MMNIAVTLPIDSLPKLKLVGGLILFLSSLIFIIVFGSYVYNETFTFLLALPELSIYEMTVRKKHVVNLAYILTIAIFCITIFLSFSWYLIYRGNKEWAMQHSKSKML